MNADLGSEEGASYILYLNGLRGGIAVVFGGQCKNGWLAGSYVWGLA